MNNPLWQTAFGAVVGPPGAAAFDQKHAMTQNGFTGWDYAALAVFLAASLAVGLIASCVGRKDKSGGLAQTDKEEFVMGNRQLQVVPVALSLLVSFNSAILILGGPAEIYFNGTMYVLSIFAENMGVLLAAVVFVPVFYNLRLTSSFEYLELRFKSRMVRLMGNFLLLINNVIYMGIALYAPATALEYVSRNVIPVEVSIAVSGVICTFYTAWGGIKAVIWTDVFQSIVMTAGILAIIIKGLMDLGGFGNIWAIADKYGRIEFDNFSFDPRVRHTFWGLVFANGVAYSSTFGVFQASVQRYCSVKTLRKAQLSVILASLGAGFFVVAACVAGLVIFAYYASVGCDPSAAGWISDSNKIVPFYVMENLHIPVVPGLFVASLFAGALSSVSSSLSALAATTWEDFMKPYCCTKASDVKAAWINRFFIVIYGVAAVLMGLMSTKFGGTVLQASLAFTGSFGAPLLGLFSMGVLFPFVNKYGALAGSVVGLVVSGWLSIGSYLNGKQLVGLPTNISNCDFGTPDPTVTTLGVSSPTAGPTAAPYVNPLDNWYSISYVWFPVIGAAATSASGFIVSLFTCGHREQVPESLLNPYAAKAYKVFCGCWCHGGVVSPGDPAAVEMAEGAEPQQEELEEVQVVSEKLADQSEESVGDQPIDQSEESAGDQPIDQSEESVGDQPIDQSEESSGDKPIDQSEDSSGDKPIDQSEESSGDKPIDQSEESSGDKPAGPSPVDNKDQIV